MTGSGTLRTDPRGPGDIAMAQYHNGTMALWRYRQRALGFHTFMLELVQGKAFDKCLRAFIAQPGAVVCHLLMDRPGVISTNTLGPLVPATVTRCVLHTLPPYRAAAFFKNGLGFSPNPDYSQHSQTPFHPFPLHNPIRTAPVHYPVLCMSNRPLR